MLNVVRDNPDKEWVYHLLSINPYRTSGFVRDNPDKDWNYHLLLQKRTTLLREYLIIEKIKNIITYFKTTITKELTITHHKREQINSV
jgi:hypothetical protein